MGYQTEFEGNFKLNHPMTDDQQEYLNTFSLSRRVALDVNEIKSELPIRIMVGLPYGEQGEYVILPELYCGELPYDKAAFEENQSAIIDYNTPPKSQPGLWCDWGAYNNTEIAWNGSEKFYEYIEWIQYIIDHFMSRWGYVLNGSVQWQGEERRDKGIIVVTNNLITIKRKK